MIRIKDEKGALTVEASMVLPLFLMAIIVFVYVIQLFYVYSNVNMALFSACKRVSLKAYYDDKKLDVSTREYQNSRSNNYYRQLLCDSLSEEIINTSCIKNGIDGIDTSESNYDMEDEMVNLYGKYTMNIPFFNIGIPNGTIKQHMIIRGWTGDKSLRSNKNFVYITKTGTAYHTDIQCTYLMIKTKLIKRNDINNYRNEGGAKYYECKECDNEEKGEYVYITKYGSSYHNTITCSGIKRTIIPIDIQEVKGRKKCAKCCG